jgi:hypothetical protein
MIQVLHQVQESEVLRSWALAEFSNPMRWDQLAQFAPAEVVQRLRLGVPTDENDWKTLEVAIRQFRDPLLKGLLALQVRWHSVELVVKDLEALRVIAYGPLVEVAPSRVLKDIVKVLEKDRQIDGGTFNVNVHRIRAGFDQTQMKGRPIMVAASLVDQTVLDRRIQPLLSNAAGGLGGSTARPKKSHSICRSLRRGCLNGTGTRMEAQPGKAYVNDQVLIHLQTMAFDHCAQHGKT